MAFWEQDCGGRRTDAARTATGDLLRRGPLGRQPLVTHLGVPGLVSADLADDRHPLANASHPLGDFTKAMPDEAAMRALREAACAGTR